MKPQKHSVSKCHVVLNHFEGIETRTNLLLIDEDTCATNFMVRDVNMDKLVTNKTVNEPITPFISKIRAMYTQLGVSSILVIGGVGSYFQVADQVILYLKFDWFTAHFPY